MGVCTLAWLSVELSKHSKGYGAFLSKLYKVRKEKQLLHGHYTSVSKVFVTVWGLGI